MAAVMGRITAAGTCGAAVTNAKPPRPAAMSRLPTMDRREDRTLLARAESSEQQACASQAEESKAQERYRLACGWEHSRDSGTGCRHDALEALNALHLDSGDIGCLAACLCTGHVCGVRWTSGSLFGWCRSFGAAGGELVSWLAGYLDACDRDGRPGSGCSVLCGCRAGASSRSDHLV